MAAHGDRRRSSSTESDSSASSSGSSSSAPGWFDADGVHKPLVDALESHSVHVIWELGPLNSPSGGDPLVLPGVVRHASGDIPVVVKIVPPDKSRAVQREMQLREQLAQNAAAHVAVPLHSVIVHAGAIAVVMRRASSDLFHALEDVVSPGDSPNVVKWLQQVAACLAQLHAIGVAHRDVKPENVLLFPTPTPAARHSNDAVLAAQHDWEDSSMYPGEAPLALQLYASGGSIGSSVEYTAALCDFEFATMRRPSADGSAPPESMMACAPYGTDTYTGPESYPKMLLQNRPEKYFDVWMPHTHRMHSKKIRGFTRHAPRSRVPDVPEHAVATRVLQQKYDCAAADVWAFGVMVFTICTNGAYPFKAACPSRPHYTAFIRRYYNSHIKSTPRDKRPAWNDAAGHEWVWPTSVPHGARHLVTLCWHPDPAQRPRMTDVAAHPWLLSPGWLPDAVAAYAQYMVPETPSASPAAAHAVNTQPKSVKKKHGRNRHALKGAKCARR